MKSKGKGAGRKGSIETTFMDGVAGMGKGGKKRGGKKRAAGKKRK